MNLNKKRNDLDDRERVMEEAEKQQKMMERTSERANERKKKQFDEVKRIKTAKR